MGKAAARERRDRERGLEDTVDRAGTARTIDGVDGVDAAPDPFVGRHGALIALRAALRSAGRPRAHPALIIGEPGIGKTRLMAELADGFDGRVLWASCWDGDGAPAFWPWVQVVRELGASAAPGDAALELRDLAPAADEDAARFQMFDAVAAQLAGASSSGPVLIAIDDLQWADVASLRLLRFVARDPRIRSIAIVAASRDGLALDEPAMSELVAEAAAGGVLVRLDGLEVTAVGELLEASGCDPDLAAGVHRRSGGNPLFVREFARLDPEPRDSAIPSGVQAVVQLRLGALEPAVRGCLTAAAVLGLEFDADALAGLVDVPSTGVESMVRRAASAGLVRPDLGRRGRWAFTHAVVQEVCASTSTATERSLLHGRAAAIAIGRSGGRAEEEIAHHLLLAGSEHAHEAFDWAVRAAEHCLRSAAYERSASWYRQALRVDGVDVAPAEEADLLIRQGEAALAAGDTYEAADAFRQAAVAARAAGDAVLVARAALGTGAGFAGFEVPSDDPAQVALLREALEALGPEPSGVRARVLARLSIAVSSGGRDDRSAALAAEAVDVARAAGDEAALGAALAAHCDVVAGPDHVEERARAAAEIIELAGRLGDRPLALLGRRLRFVALLEAGDVLDADDELARFASVAAELGQPVYQWYVPLWRATRALMVGDLAAATAGTAEASEIGERASSFNAFALTLTQRWVTLRSEGRYREAGALLRDAAGLGPGAAPLVGGPDLARLRALVAFQDGDVDVARVHLDAVLAAGLARWPHNAEWLPEMVQLAEIAAGTAHHEAIGQFLDLLTPYADRYCVEGIGAAFTGSVAWYLAMLAGARGDERAETWLVQARAAHRRVGLTADPPRLAEAPTAAAPAGSTAAASAGSTTAPATLVAEGATWAVTFGGTTRRLRDSKGIRDLAVLLARPGQEVHCLELIGGTDTGGDTGPALDQRARAAYEDRIRDLHEDIEEARTANDLARAERAEDELDVLVQQLAQAFGLSGRARTSGSAAERARTTVTSRIRAAIRGAAATHPLLGRHLERAVRTGTWCSYSPEHPVDWTIAASDPTS